VRDPVRGEHAAAARDADFPANRENKREFLNFSITSIPQGPISHAVAEGYDDRLLRCEQGISWAQTGNVLADQGIPCHPIILCATIAAAIENAAARSP
jgi:hypothetical protein